MVSASVRYSSNGAAAAARTPGAAAAAAMASKWLGLVAAIWVQAIAGNNYGFSNYSVALKAVGSYNQVELNNLGVAKDVGKALGVVAGLISDHLPPWLTLLIGSLEGLLGYGAQWAVLSSRISPPPYWQMCVFLCMGGNSTTWMNTAVLVTCVRNFNLNRGPVVGILKGYIGLSTAIFTVLCSSLFSNDPAVFVLMLALVPFVVCVVAMVLMHPAAPAAGRQQLEQERSNLVLLNMAATVLAVYLLFYDFLAAAGPPVLLAGVLLLLLAAPLYVPIRMFLSQLLARKKDEADCEQQLLADSAEQQEEQQADEDIVEDVVQHLEQQPCSSLPCSKEDVKDEQEIKPAAAAPQLGEDHTPLQALKRFEFWLLFVSLLCGMGTGTVVINNLGQIGQTLGYNDVATFVSLTSVWGFFGRIGSGLVSEHYLRSHALPRPAWLAASQLVSVLGFVVLLLAFPGSLYIGSSVIGLTYGVRLAVTVPTASELFGLKYFGLFYNILIINIPLGSFLFSGLLAGILYDMEADKLPGVSNSLVWLRAPSCVGTHCFRITFIIMIVVCLVGFSLDVLMALATRPVYRRLQLAAKASRRS